MLSYLLPCLQRDDGGIPCFRVGEPPKIKEIGKTLGEGSFAVVSLVKDLADREFALKRSKDTFVDKNIFDEHAILLFLNEQSARGRRHIIQQEVFLFYEERASLLLEPGKETVYETAYCFPLSLKKVFESYERSEEDVEVNYLLADLVKKMLALDPEKRIDPLEGLNHPFFRRESQDCCLFAWLDP